MLHLHDTESPALVLVHTGRSMRSGLRREPFDPAALVACRCRQGGGPHYARKVKPRRCVRRCCRFRMRRGHRGGNDPSAQPPRPPQVSG